MPTWLAVYPVVRLSLLRLHVSAHLPSLGYVTSLNVSVCLMSLTAVWFWSVPTVTVPDPVTAFVMARVFPATSFDSRASPLVVITAFAHVFIYCTSTLYDSARVMAIATFMSASATVFIATRIS